MAYNCPECGKPLKKSKAKARYFCENNACSVIFVRDPDNTSKMEITHSADARGMSHATENSQQDSNHCLRASSRVALARASGSQSARLEFKEACGYRTHDQTPFCRLRRMPCDTVPPFDTCKDYVPQSQLKVREEAMRGLAHAMKVSNSNNDSGTVHEASTLDESTIELVFSRDCVMIRSPVVVPLKGRLLHEERIGYNEIPSGGLNMQVMSIEKQEENNQLKALAFKVSRFEQASEEQQATKRTVSLERSGMSMGQLSPQTTPAQAKDECKRFSEEISTKIQCPDCASKNITLTKSSSELVCLDCGCMFHNQKQSVDSGKPTTTLYNSSWEKEIVEKYGPKWYLKRERTCEEHQTAEEPPTSEQQTSAKILVKSRSCIEYSYLSVTGCRSIFPAYRVPFVLMTDQGEISTYVSNAVTGTPIGAPLKGTTISGLKPWYLAHPEIRVGDTILIETIEPKKRYRLSILGHTQQSELPIVEENHSKMPQMSPKEIEDLLKKLP